MRVRKYDERKKKKEFGIDYEEKKKKKKGRSESGNKSRTTSPEDVCVRALFMCTAFW